ncbi:related to Kinesin-7a motor protein [Melanopsichium pennsylvanicum]|uniref:Related to Kinesin-7a motor protein n=2 Tax=Melanopsichium pennsylvanicum TaxID=63383 RepID=A0AAJ5C374_9BASI|nr:Kinesin-7a motor protein [Melanopsichium pennsylvanicum 4]SNX82306.1 related to Kinesin-7a motor protein [Melanopsichium pennsylvanicum]
MFRFRSSNSSASSTPPTSPLTTAPAKHSNQPSLPSIDSASPSLSTADSVPSTTSNSSILSLLQAHSSSTSLSSALSPATSLSHLACEPCLTSEALHIEPTKATASQTRIASSASTPSTKSLQSHAALASPRRSSLVISPRTSKATISTTIAQVPPSPNASLSRRSSFANNIKQHRSSNAAIMAKKAKVGSSAKSSPFTKLASNAATKEGSALSEKPCSESTPARTNTESSLTTVVEDDTTTPSTSAIPSPIKPAAEMSSLSSSSESKQNVVVCVRMRPTRATSTEAPVWNADSLKNQIVPTEHHPAIAKRTTSSERAGASTSIAAAPSLHDLESEDAPTSTYHFQFDKLILAPQTTDDMYHSHISPVVRAAMEGYNGTVFAYGQTGSGKTHTMSGSDKEPGVIPRAVQQVFQMIKNEPDREFLLRVSYLEIYNETLKDLLAPLPPLSNGSLQTTERPASPIKTSSSHSTGQSQSSTLRIIEDQKSARVIMTGLREEIVTQAETVLDLLQRGQDERHVGATDWNERSSRSHCVFQLTIESRANDAHSGGGKEVRISQLNLIDLAGSERAASQVERRKEGAFINKSLLTLGTVIGKLTEPSDSGDAHIPYRDSKLTRILQTSLSGNARIAVICTLSPDAEHANETLSTLKFGKRCKSIVTTAKKGTAMDDKALLQKYRKELDALRARLEANGSSPNPDNVIMAAVSPEVPTEERAKLDELNKEKEATQKEVEDMQKKRMDLKGQIEHLTRLILTSQSVADDVKEGNAVAGPSTPVRGRNAHASALARRGPRMSDLFSGTGSGYNSPTTGHSSIFSDQNTTLSGVKPFQLEAELAALRKQLRMQIESREILISAHTAELATRDSRATELQEAIRLNEQELDEAEVAYEKLKEERDEARRIALKEQEKARENKRKLLEEQEANRLLKLVAKARAGDEDKALQNQIESLTERLKEKEAEAKMVKEKFEAELERVKKEVEEEKAARSQAARKAAEAASDKQALQAELDAALANSAELTEKLAKAGAESNEADDDDVNAEFKDLVRGKGAHQPDGSSARLEQLETTLSERESQLASLRLELESTRHQLASKPLATNSTTTQSSDIVCELATLRDDLSQSQEERQELQVELAKLQAAATGREQEAQRSATLDSELTRANAKVAELEKQVLAEKARTEEALTTVARPLPVPTSLEGGYRSVPSSPTKTGFIASGSKLKPTATPASHLTGSGLNRAGSVKEYRRYNTNGANEPSSPSPALGARSGLLGHHAVFGGVGASNKAEREEIERLNAVINSQRAIMADLENSVASWKARMRAQAELIQKLVVQNDYGGGSGGQSPPTSDVEADEVCAASPRRRQLHTVPEGGFSSLPRTTHLSLAQQQQHHREASEPYYGAHTYNKPPQAHGNVGLGMLPASPQKFNMATWSASSPNPLPLPEGGMVSPSKRKPRKTIEMDLKLLKSSPRVESNKTKFSLNDFGIGVGSSQDTPTKKRGTNASAYYI